MRKTKETHTFDFRPLGLAIREAREKAGLSRNDLGDKVFYGERHIADIENVGSHPSFQLFHDLVTMFNISVDEYFYPTEKVAKSTARKPIINAIHSNFHWILTTNHCCCKRKNSSNYKYPKRNSTNFTWCNRWI